MADENLRGIFLVCYENLQRAPLPLLLIERTSPCAGKLNFPNYGVKHMYSIHTEDENVPVIQLLYTNKFTFLFSNVACY